MGFIVAKKKTTDTQNAPEKPTPFTTIRALSETRPFSYAEAQKNGWPYDQYLINRAFSMTEDTVIMASMMNERHFVSNDMHAAFYVSTVRPRKRFEKWPKGAEEEEVKLLCNYYGMSPREARLSVGIHTDSQLAEMRQLLQNGVRRSRQ